MSGEMIHEFRRRGPRWGLIVTVTLLVIAALVAAGALVAIGVKLYADARKPPVPDVDELKRALADLPAPVPGDLQVQMGQQFRQLQGFLDALQGQLPGGADPALKPLPPQLGPPRPGRLDAAPQVKPGQPFGPRRLGIPAEAVQGNREGQFQSSNTENGVTLTVEGVIANGHVTVDRVVIDDGVAPRQFANLEAVPEPYREKARALVERSTRGRAGKG